MADLRRRTLTAALLFVLVPAAGLVAGCGDDGDSAKRAASTTSAARPLGEMLGGSVATLAQCSDWNPGSTPRKLATIADIRSQLNRTDAAVDAPPLSDEEAMQLFDRACAPTYASGFRLYVLYARAAGFGPLLRQVEK
ncbi:hypothetical protein [Paraconexibacter sp.]|uniref:hypothetical protein n=1 Tax=Paraconexibacter sp. TaxID=2949640 RepID=UPI0035669A66